MLCLSKTIDDNALETLKRLGLNTKESGSCKEQGIEIERPHKKHDKRHEEITPGGMQGMVREAVISEILKAFP